jgi:thiol:disulfide interchange protein DsbD
MKSMKALSLTILLSALGTAAFGQIVDGKQITKAELITDAADFTKPFNVGVRFVLEGDWYLYWKNPGDSGLPIDVKWDLPKSWRASELRYPVPTKFAYDNLVSYGYKKQVVLLATISPGPEPLDVLKARLDWLVCKESCVRGKAEVAISITGEHQAEDVQAALTDAQQKLPGPIGSLSLSVRESRIRKTANGWEAEITLAGAGAITVTDFYPEISEEIVIEFNSITVKDGVLRFRFDRQESGKDVVNVRGLFISGAKGFEDTIPLQFTSM